MADSPLGQHVQGSQDYGETVAQYPVLVTVEDATGKVGSLALTGAGGLPVSVVSGGGGPVTVADCADVTQGCIADAAVTGDNPGTVSAKLRGLIKMFGDVWDSANHRLNVFIQNATLAVTQSGAWTVTANQGTPNAAGTNSWPVQGAGAAGAATVGNPMLGGMTDGVNTQAWVQGPNSTPGLSSSTKGIGAVSAVLIDSGGSYTPYAAARTLGDADSGRNWAPTARYLWTGASYDRERTPKVFKSAQATASGNTAVWTPTAGKKFRLMRLYLELTENVIRAAAGVITITFQDATTDLGIAFDVWVPAAALTTAGNEWQSGWIDLGNGILSAAANNVLNVNLSAALTGGNLRAFVCGTEE